ncbi:ribosomal protein S7 [Wallemia mellicola CBS 633.66]|uniref:Ribosomal protein S7 n=1 Tax=Wallemia mellicola (strain ATCC MYA-4683 / CBS 633.66) TaxID=671144 RepID=I4YEE2_WALMC|nr:ribosomal protein S7 [Wallemia mellicola CBS 633.66]EIM22334.1 ribosomal protein S7 [Wallemia mellicola CBS 633.66]|eukprot:XP_006957589.1 ribosomal protein S7 [Wallemia mellicola CBS 633.66]
MFKRFLNTTARISQESHFEQITRNGYSHNPSAIPPSSDPLLGYLTNLIMKDGKKARAQSHLKKTLTEIKTLTANTTEPVSLVRNAITMAAPSFRLSSSKKNNKVLHTPLALTERQRIRLAFQALIKASDKRNEKFLHQRLAREVLAILEQQSDVLKRKEEIHKAGAINRANLVQAMLRR